MGEIMPCHNPPQNPYIFSGIQCVISTEQAHPDMKRRKRAKIDKRVKDFNLDEFNIVNMIIDLGCQKIFTKDTFYESF